MGLDCKYGLRLTFFQLVWIQLLLFCDKESRNVCVHTSHVTRCTSLLFTGGCRSNDARNTSLKEFIITVCAMHINRRDLFLYHFSANRKKKNLRKGMEFMMAPGTQITMFTTFTLSNSSAKMAQRDHHCFLTKSSNQLLYTISCKMF